MPPLTRTQKRQAATRERIFRVAMDLFAQQGFENTTVAEITEAADIGKGTFFTYFPTKEAIFRQPGEMAMASMTLAAQQGLDAGKPLAKVLKNTLTAFADWHEANRTITQQMSKSSAAFAIDDTSNKGKLLELLGSLIVAGQKSGEFNKRVKVEDAAILLAGLYFTVIAAWAHSGGRPLRDRMEATLDIILKGMLA